MKKTQVAAIILTVIAFASTFMYAIRDPAKPFTILTKSRLDGQCVFDYTGANGARGGFVEDCKRYSVGDTVY